MELLQIKSKRKLIVGILLILFIILFSKLLMVSGKTNEINETADGYYTIGNNIEVKISIVDKDLIEINNNNLVYNGQKVFLKINWRTSDDSLNGTSMEIKLPINEKGNQIQFKSPLEETVDIVSDDRKTLTSLKKDGGIITNFFDASEQSPIIKNSSGEILIPHNIVVPVNSSDYDSQSLELVLITDSGNEKVIRKPINRIKNGIEINSVLLMDKTGKEEKTSFKNLRGNIAILKLEYISDRINDGDSISIKLNDFESENAKVKPYAFNDVNIKDNSGNVVGTIIFEDSSSSSNDTFVRIKFNDYFKGKPKVSGYVSIPIGVAFKSESNDYSNINITIGNKINTIKVLGPTLKLEPEVTRLQIAIPDTKLIRRGIVLNQEGILEEEDEQGQEIEVYKNSIVNEKLDSNDYYIVKDSIRIVKILGAKKYSNTTINYYDIDKETLKDVRKADTNVDVNKEFWDKKSGLTIDEFKQYATLNTEHTFTYDDKGNINGFTINLGNINDTKGTNGEYLSVKSYGGNKAVLKDNKAFGYLIYYNIEAYSDLTGTSEEGFGSFKITLKDGETSELIENCVLKIEGKDKNVSLTNNTIITNQYGVATTDSIPYGEYKVRLLNAPTGYTSKPTIDVKVESSTIIKSYEISITGGAEIEVIGRVNGEAAGELENIQFSIYSSHNKWLPLKIVKLNNEGKASFGHMPFGRYYIREEKGPTNLLISNKEIPMIASYRNINELTGKIGIGLNYKKDINETTEEYLELEDEITPLAAPNINNVENVSGSKVLEVVNQNGETNNLDETENNTSGKGNPVTGDYNSVAYIFIISFILIILIILREKIMV